MQYKLWWHATDIWKIWTICLQDWPRKKEIYCFNIKTEPCIFQKTTHSDTFHWHSQSGDLCLQFLNPDIFWNGSLSCVQNIIFHISWQTLTLPRPSHHPNCNNTGIVSEKEREKRQLTCRLLVWGLGHVRWYVNATVKIPRPIHGFSPLLSVAHPLRSLRLQVQA